MRRLILAVTLIFGQAAPAWADLPEGLAAYNARDFVAAYKALRPLAEKGDPTAQVCLGVMHERGVAVPELGVLVPEPGVAVPEPGVAVPPKGKRAAPDFSDLGVAFKGKFLEEAIPWYRRAAEQGHAGAQHRLAEIYSSGLSWYGYGVPQDWAIARSWLLKAAAQGFVASQLRLGAMYEEGKGAGVPQDYTAAAQWYRKAAEQGDVRGQFHIGRMYEQGKGVPQDYVVAHMWYNLVAARGIERAAENRDKIAKFMSQSQIAEAQRLARDWLAPHEKGASEQPCLSGPW